MKKKRIIYAIAFIILLAVEVLIALFIHDSFIRPYVGDMLVVIVVYSFIRIFIPERVRLMPLWVFIFASCVELLQLFGLVERLGLEGNAFFRVLIGSVFDIKDILCYAVGCVLLGIHEYAIARKTSPKQQ